MIRIHCCSLVLTIMTVFTRSLAPRFAPLSKADVLADLSYIYDSRGKLCVLLSSNDSSEQQRQMMGFASLLACATFGIQLFVGIHCLRSLFEFKSRPSSRLFQLLILHIFALELANTVGLVTTILGFQWYLGPITTFTSELHYIAALPPNGPQLGPILSACPISTHDELLIAELHSWTDKFRGLNIVSTAAFAYIGLATDAMLIWRCRQIWKFTFFSYPNLVVAVPTVLLVGAAAISGAYCLYGLDSIFAFAYFTTSLILNIILTSLIVYRLLECKLEAKTALGERHGGHYNILSTLFVESAFLNAICSILLLASFLSSASNIKATFDVWVAMTPAVQACANYLILYRGARRFDSSWSQGPSYTDSSTLIFAQARVSATDRRDDHDELDGH